MKDFIRRNSPVLIIGAILLIIFLVIIAISNQKKQYEPTLIKIEPEVREIPEDTTNNASPSAPSVYVPTVVPVAVTSPTTLKVTTNPIPLGATPEEARLLRVLEEDKIKNSLPKDVVYTAEKGFDPEFLIVSKNQTINWINKSNSIINLYESSITYPELKKPFSVRPGEKLTFSPYKPRLFVIGIEGNEDQKSAVFVNGDDEDQ